MTLASAPAPVSPTLHVSQQLPDPILDPGRGALSAVPDDEVLVINLDIPSLVTRIFITLPDLREVEAQVAQRWRQPLSGSTAGVERCAFGLHDVHRICLALQCTLPSPSSLARDLAMR